MQAKDINIHILNDAEHFDFEYKLMLDHGMDIFNPLYIQLLGISDILHWFLYSQSFWL